MHLFHMETLPDELVALLEDPRVLKSGVGVTGDVKKLRAGYNVGTRGAVEVCWRVVSVVGCRRSCAAWGLSDSLQLVFVFNIFFDLPLTLPASATASFGGAGI